MSIFNKIKVSIGKILGNAYFGRMIRLAYGDYLSIGDGKIYIGEPISPNFVASVFWSLHEKHERRMVQKYLDDDLDVIELGACIGGVTAEILGRKKSGRVLIIEANPNLISSLEKTAEKNSLGKNIQVEIIHCALTYVGNDKDELVFQVDNGLLGSKINTENIDFPNKIAVPTCSLGDIKQKYGIGEHALVCDIEGEEAGLLMGDREELSKAKDIIIELHDWAMYKDRTYSIDEMRKIFTDELGYRELERHGNVFAYTRL